MKLRRSRLYIPGNNPGQLQHAGIFGADVISLDLEDAVAPDSKTDARMLVGESLRTLDFGRSEITVRINPLSTLFGKDDIKEVVCQQLDAIYIPKTETPEDVLQADDLITRREEEMGLEVGRIKLFATMETAKGILNAYDIARSCKRLEGITIGGEDLTADLGGERSADGIAINTARSMILLAAKACGLQAIDTVYSDTADDAGLRSETTLIKRMGFDGKACIHPNQIPIIHDVFNPTKDELVFAQKVIHAIEDAKSKGSGVIAIGTKMVDRPIQLRADKLLARARAAELPIPRIEDILAEEAAKAAKKGKGGDGDG